MADRSAPPSAEHAAAGRVPAARTVAILLTTTALAGAALFLHGAPLANATAPGGVIAFELARTEQDAHAILDSWERAGATERARSQIAWDFGFLLLYSTAAALLYLRLAKRIEGIAPGLARWGRRLAWAQWAAAAADAVENALLLVQLQSGAAGWAAAGAWVAAMVKFALLALGPLWLVLAAIAVQKSGQPIFQLLYACRFPLLSALALVALGPVAAGPAEELLQNLFALGPWEAAAVTLLACLCAWTALLALEGVLAYADLRLPGVDRPPARLLAWLRRRRTLVTAYLVAPLWLTGLVVTIEGATALGWPTVLWLAGSAAGVAGAIVLYRVAGWLQARTAPAPVAAAAADPGRPAAAGSGRLGPAESGGEAQNGRAPEPAPPAGEPQAGDEAELLLLRRRAPEIAAQTGAPVPAPPERPATLSPAPEHPDAAPAAPGSPAPARGSLFRRLVRGLEHLLVRRLFAHLGPGYVRRGAAGRLELLEGHRRSFWFFGVTALVYLAGWWALGPRVLGPYFPPLGFVLILILGSTWVLPGLSFFFDRYRVPVTAAVVLYAVAAATLLAGVRDLDHRFDTVDRRGAFTGPLEVFDAAERAVPGDRPLVVVAASGGGIRASRWTARALTALEDPGLGVGPELGSAVRFVSSVSGGSAGSYFWLAHRVPGSDGGGADHVLEAAGASCLHGSTWGLAYPDLWRAVPPPVVGWTGLGLGRDRGWGLEECWRRVDHLDDGLDRLGTWAEHAAAGALPAFALNTTVVETGEPFLFTPFGLPKGWGAVGFADQFRDSDVRVTTAARLSATFPWVTPVARADDDALGRLPAVDGRTNPDRRRFQYGHHLADGGYYDNTGAVTALSWIDTVLRERAEVRRRGVVLVLLGAYPEPGRADGAPTPEILRRTSERGGGLATEVSGPMKALLAVRSSSQSNRNRREIDDLRLKWWHAGGVRIEPFRFDYDGEAPLSWKLTAQERAAIDLGWSDEDVQRELGWLKACFGDLDGAACAGRRSEWTPLPPRGVPAAAPPPDPLAEPAEDVAEEVAAAS